MYITTTHFSLGFTNKILRVSNFPKLRSQKPLQLTRTLDCRSSFVKFCSTLSSRSTAISHPSFEDLLHNTKVNGTRKFKILEFSKTETGIESSYTQYDTSKEKLAQKSGLILRDLRTFTEQPFARKSIASLLVRTNAIILHIDPIKSIIMHDRIFLVNSDDHDPLVSRILRRLPYRVNRSTSVTAFEHRAVEAFLIEIVEQMDRDFKDIEPSITSLLEILLTNQSPQNLCGLLDYSDRSFEGDVTEFISALNGVLNNDEDMVAMYITNTKKGIKQDISDHVEVELMLESFVQQLTELHNNIKELRTRIDRTEQYIKIHFDGQRNVIIRFNLMISMISLSVAFCALGASIFGMNLMNGLEHHPYAFFITTGGLGLAFISVLSACYFRYLQTKGSLLSKQSRFKVVSPIKFDRSGDISE